MAENSLTIPHPYGVCVFGSALLRVSADNALITAAVTRSEKKTSDAFLKAKEGARAVADFLRKSGVDDFGMSRISLSQEYAFTNGVRRSLGYKATIGFKIAIKALDKLEEIASGVVEAGANEIASIQFHTSSLKDVRMQARRQAIDAAKEKAAVYAQAGGVILENIIHIEDVNPQILHTQLRSQFHLGGVGPPPSDLIEHDGGRQTLDPGAIEVTAAVLVAFGLGQAKA
jgi:uncharacterized protein YggE